jgi:hypothetical protein
VRIKIDGYELERLSPTQVVIYLGDEKLYEARGWGPALQWIDEHPAPRNEEQTLTFEQRKKDDGADTRV